MSDVRLEREFAVSPSRLFDVISTRVDLVEWWGHDGWTMRDAQLDFSQLGPWHAAMISEEGNLYKMSGQVTSVTAGRSVGFTWAWHDAQDARGVESHVTFTVAETQAGAKLIIDHRDLPTDDIAAQHAKGWAGPLGRLERFLQELT